MKKIIIAMISLFMIISFTTIVSATTVTTTTGGAAVAIGSITFNPSPSTVMSVTTIDDEFVITSASAKTTTDNGIEYGIDSSSNALYQKTQETDGAVTATSGSASPLTLPTPADWEDRAGNAASAS